MKKLLTILFMFSVGYAQKKPVDVVNYYGVDYVFYDNKTWVSVPVVAKPVDSICLPNGKKYLLKKNRTYILIVTKKKSK